MAKSHNCKQEISMLVCFAGCKQRIVIDTEKCLIFNEGTFSYTTYSFVASDGLSYKVQVDSIPNNKKGYSTHANVRVSRHCKLVAERNNVPIRFARKLFTK